MIFLEIPWNPFKIHTLKVSFFKKKNFETSKSYKNISEWGLRFLLWKNGNKKRKRDEKRGLLFKQWWEYKKPSCQYLNKRDEENAKQSFVTLCPWLPCGIFLQKKITFRSVLKDCAKCDLNDEIENRGKKIFSRTDSHRRKNERHDTRLPLAGVYILLTCMCFRGHLRVRTRVKINPGICKINRRNSRSTLKSRAIQSGWNIRRVKAH